jgi:hypothetical protein
MKEKRQCSSTALKINNKALHRQGTMTNMLVSSSFVAVNSRQSSLVDSESSFVP